MIASSPVFDSQPLRFHLERVGFTADTIETNFVLGDRRLPLLAFSHRPFDTRTACLSAAPFTEDREAFLRKSRIAGAPLAFIGNAKRFDVYRQSSEAAELLWTPNRGEIGEFFELYREELDPRSLFRAKVSRSTEENRQSTFVEAGLLEIIEGEVSSALCQLVEKMVVTTGDKLSLRALKNLKESDAQWLVKANFWLLAARLLQDKEVHGFKTLDFRDIENVFTRVGRHYGTPMEHHLSAERKDALGEAAQLLKTHSSLRLVSTETLARVYENVLVTKETRKALGTHSTPAWLVEYMVNRLAPWISEQGQKEMRVFEPGCGHAPFLVALLRHFSASEPCLSMDDETRHEWLKARLHGAEVDDFAREVARLSMTLADIPNANGWHLKEGDMFTNGCLETEIKKADIIISNPPFEARDFKEDSSDNIAKLGQDAELLRLINEHAKPGALIAYVMRQSLLDSEKFVDLRKDLLRDFEWFEILRLPDKVFEKAEVETAILLGRRTSPRKDHQFYFKHVWDGQTEEFRNGGFAKSEGFYSQERIFRDAEAKMLVPDLVEIWDHLGKKSTLRDQVTMGRGSEYLPTDHPRYPHGYPQKSPVARKGYQLGFFNMMQPALSHGFPPLTYMLRDERSIKGKMAGYETGISRVIMNHARVGRGAWRNLAYFDEVGRFTRSRFLVLTPLEKSSLTPVILWAILNSPVANAFTRAFSSKRDILATTLYQLPIPKLSLAQASKIKKAAIAYRKAADKTNLTHKPKPSEVSEASQGHLNLLDSQAQAAPTKKVLESLKYLHWKMDVAVLAAYDLPGHLEGRLLNFFQGQERVGVPFDQTEYFPQNFVGGEKLADLISISGDWSKTNKQRLKLIDQEVDESLTEEDNLELQRLQELATLRRRLIDPYPMAELDAKIDKMKREGKWTD